ncbi:uncharacterized protein BX664DRAFT_328258 [Halteromyces radiatus]|uniref:uncharacterized protein n=1 Tax=Halteromyces radiatus TaxID=101107 RepID=UPI00222126B9|nr:uncharacterized protein BX664DRAFT_328258 [Halteromyces radiatus]KAI8092831.1 hypothetical protein BX664DRAFT_328258 [Halteromyces radiatus]
MSFQLSSVWQVLGPFPIGMREQDFGADPLEAYGGFSQLKYSKTSQFPSELSPKGQVGWTKVKSIDNVVGPLLFPDIRWEQNGIPFGWSIEQYQAWARGNLKISKKSHILIQLHGVTSFYINQQKYSGDLYGYKSTLHWVELETGTYSLEVRLVHDVRVFGGGNKNGPQCQFSISIYPLDCGTMVDDALFPRQQYHRFHSNTSTANTTTLLGRDMIKQVLMPSFIQYQGFAGHFGSVSIHNLIPETLHVVSIRLVFQAYHHISDVITVLRPAILLQRSNHTTMVKGQQRRIGFSFDLKNNTVHDETLFLQANKVHVKVIVTFATSTNTFTLVDDSTTINSIDWNQMNTNNRNKASSVEATTTTTLPTSSVFLYTFLDFDGSVQYAKAKRPKVLDANENKPIILALHGAGVDVEHDTFWTDSIDAQDSVWIVFPTGRTSWGMDWHGPSMKNAFYSLEGLAEVMDLLFSRATDGNRSQPSDDQDWIVVEKSESFSIGNINRLIYMGHSNGGQGVWYLATHHPDRAIAAVAAAGYVKIQDYVSYNNWISHSHIDPLLFGVLESAYAEYNNDLHLSNMVGLPVLAKCGSEDDNVPPLHSRKYVRLLNEYSKNPNLIKLSEVEGKGHWWDTVLNDQETNDFLKKIIQQNDNLQPSSLNQHHFIITTTNPASLGVVHGIQIEQLLIPYRKSSLVGDMDTENNSLNLKSLNVSAFKICNRKESTITIDQMVFHHVNRKEGVLFVLDNNGKWMIETSKWPKRGERSRLSYGPIHRVYESSKPLMIVIPNQSQSSTIDNYRHLALQISHDWYLYGGGDSMIVTDDHPLVTFEEIEMESTETMNNRISPFFFRIYLDIGNDNQAVSQLLGLNGNNVDIEINHSAIQVGSRYFDRPGSGILFLSPGSLNEMAIVISGLDLEGLQLACQLLPRRTGMLIPEWVVTSPLTKEQGVGGILGAGYFGNNWQAFGY